MVCILWWGKLRPCMGSLEFTGRVSCNHARPELALPQDSDHWIVWPDHYQGIWCSNDCLSSYPTTKSYFHFRWRFWPKFCPCGLYRFCDDARAFNCRAFAQKDDRCFLSGDDSVTLRGGGGGSADQPPPPLPIEVGAVYKEKICTRSKPILQFFHSVESCHLVKTWLDTIWPQGCWRLVAQVTWSLFLSETWLQIDFQIPFSKRTYLSANKDWII